MSGILNCKHITANCIDVSVEDIAININIYPNPFTNWLHVAYDGTIEIEVRNVTGQLMTIPMDGTNGEYRLDFSTMESGVFVLTIYEDGYVYNHKVVHVAN